MLVFLMRFKVSCIIYYFLHLGCSLFGLFVPHFAFLACNLSAYKISFIKNSLRNFRDYMLFPLLTSAAGIHSLRICFYQLKEFILACTAVTINEDIVCLLSFFVSYIIRILPALFSEDMFNVCRFYFHENHRSSV